MMTSEMLRGIMRGRGADAASKRELNFPYTNSSTPEAGYGPSPSPFPGSSSSYTSGPSYTGDNDKQRKKKGKKHRHGNASSSSGNMENSGIPLSGTPDAQMMQARLHQHNLNAGAFSQQSGMSGGYTAAAIHNANGYSQQRWG